MKEIHNSKKGRFKPNARVTIGNIELKNPVIASSGTFGYAKEFEPLIPVNNLGAIITKTITVKPKSGNSPPRIAETPCGMLNAIGLANKGVDEFIKNKLPYLKKLGVPIIVSIAGERVEEFVKLTSKLSDRKEISGIELNLSCPNLIYEAGQTIGRMMPPQFAQDLYMTYEVVKAARRVTGLTLIAKLSPNVTDIISIAKGAYDGGVDVLSLVNTFIGMAIDIQTKQPKLSSVTGGLSGPCIKPIALRMVWEVAQEVELPIIASGGIMCAEDAIEFIMAGATCVAVGCANFVNPKTCIEIITSLEDYLKKNKIKDINSLIGCLTIA